MSYCAVSVKTESGDDYVFLIEYRRQSDITEHILDSMGDEAAYICNYSVDTGISYEEDQLVEKAVDIALVLAKNLN